MSGFTKFASLLLAASLCGSVPVWAQKGGGVHKKKKQPQKTDAATPTVPAYTPSPLQPLPLDQVPAVAPRVKYSGGELTIVAHNSTLSDVLKEVKQQTGADLEIPPNATERVVADVGPGPARDVLAKLLNGTHFNYVMVGSASDPTAVQSIVLTPKSAAADTPTTTAVANRPNMPPQRFPGANVSPTPAADAQTDDNSDEPDPPEEQAEQPPDQNQQNPNQTPKTPEQLLQELQRQQQMQQQQQNPQAAQPGLLPNQPPTAAPPNPKKPE